MKKLMLLPETEFQNLKVLQIIGPEWNKFTGYLPYLRILNENYDYKSGDELDENLLQTIQKSFPKSHLSENRLIVLEGELDERMERLKFGSEKIFTVNFFPFIDIPVEQLHLHRGKSFNFKLIDFKLRLLLSEQNERFKNIRDADMCYIHYEKLNELVKTINPI